MADWRIERLDDNHLSLQGMLKFADITAIREAVDRALDTMVSPISVDFSGVDAVDSSALSLWLCSMRKAEANGAELSATGVPEELLSIARLVGLEQCFS